MTTVTERNLISQQKSSHWDQTKSDLNHLDTLTATEAEIYNLFQKEKKSIDVIAALKHVNRKEIEECLINIVEKGYPLHLSRFILKVPQQTIERVIKCTNKFLSNSNMKNTNDCDQSQENIFKSIQIKSEDNSTNLSEQNEYLQSGRLLSLQRRYPSVKLSVSLEKNVCEILQSKSQQEREVIFEQLSQHLQIEKHHVKTILIKEWKMRDPVLNSKIWQSPKMIEKRKIPVWFETISTTTQSIPFCTPRPLLPLRPGTKWPSPAIRNIPPSFKFKRITQSQYQNIIHSFSQHPEKFCLLPNKTQSTQTNPQMNQPLLQTTTITAPETETMTNLVSLKTIHLEDSITPKNSTATFQKIEKESEIKIKEENLLLKQQEITQNEKENENDKEDTLQLLNHLTPSKECQSNSESTEFFPELPNTINSSLTIDIKCDDFLEDQDNKKKLTNEITTTTNNDNNNNHDNNDNNNNNGSVEKSNCEENCKEKIEKENEMGILWKYLRGEIEMSSSQLIDYIQKIRQDSFMNEIQSNT